MFYYLFAIALIHGEPATLVNPGMKFPTKEICESYIPKQLEAVKKQLEKQFNEVDPKVEINCMTEEQIHAFNAALLERAIKNKKTDI